MRFLVCVFAAAMALAAQPASAADRAAAAYWKAVQARCTAAAAKPASELGQKVAKSALDEFNRFGGHRIDADGKLFRFGLTEAEHEEDDGGNPQAALGHLGWWQVMNYWRGLYGGDPTDKLEVRGYRDASTLTDEAKVADLLRTSAARLLKLADETSDPEQREVLREAAMRAAAVDTSWSAAFISYVVKQAGVGENAFRFSNAHRAYIYDAFAVNAAEQASTNEDHIYRACPLNTKPRLGDLICQQRESSLSGESEEAVRERIRGEVGGSVDARTVRRTHCEVVAHVDVRARAVYSIGGNVNQAVSARKMKLHGRGLRFSASQKAPCGGRSYWTLPGPAADTSKHPVKCSLNDRKWFVLLQMR